MTISTFNQAYSTNIPSSSYTNPNATATLCIGIMVATFLYYITNSNRRNNQSKTEAANSSTVLPVPWAKGGLPLLGHALAYKQDPPSFLSNQEKLVGSIFRINLAGRKMTIVGSSAASDSDVSNQVMRQIAKQSNSILSSTKAIADIGFYETLGEWNALHGPDFHRHVLKEYMSLFVKNTTIKEDEIDKDVNVILMRLRDGLVDAFDEELNLLKVSSPQDNDNHVVVPDLFSFLRRCMIRVILLYMIGIPGPGEQSFGKPVGHELEAFISEYVEIQEMIEDATAKAAVMNPYVAKRFILEPVKRQRYRLEAKLVGMIKQCWCEDNHSKSPSSTTTSSSESSKSGKQAPWLRGFKEKAFTADQAATAIIGLLFAAHKNPAIAAGQTFCHIHQHYRPLDDGSRDEQKLGINDVEWGMLQREAKQIMKNDSVCDDLANLMLGQSNEHGQPSLLYRCIIETIRLISHSIGAIRYACQDIIVKDETGQHYKIQKGDTVAIAHITTHRNKKIWGKDANEFNPNRKEWIQKEEGRWNVSICNSKVDPYKMTAFSHGVHKCPGERLALVLNQLMLSILLERNATVTSDLADMTFERATLAQREGPVCITLRS